MPKPTLVLAVVYLAAATAANLLAARYGPPITPWVALVLIGLDLTARDRLHDFWGDAFRARMGVLIAAGGVLAYAANGGAGRVAAASCVAFAAAGLVDTAAYHALRKRSWAARANGSNIPAALADSVVFPTLAFGAFLPGVVAAQFVAKVVGGFLWSGLLAKRRA